MLPHDELGAGPAVVLLHAGVADRTMWAEHLQPLADAGFRAIAVDLPGFGEATPPRDEDAPWADVLRTMDELAVGRAALVGNSFGGAVALRAALVAPNRVWALALCSAPPPGLVPSPELAAAWEAENTALDRGDIEGAVNAVVDAWTLPDASNALRERVAAMQRRAFALQAEESAAAEASDPVEQRVDGLAQLDVPALAAVGERDKRDFLEGAEALARLLPHARHAVIEHAGHLAPLETPEAFRELVVGFLRSEDQRVAWDEIAAGYDRTNTPSQMWLGNQGLRRAGLRPGMRFLDVAAGSGALSIPAARLGARVLATDLSPAMLERLERRARDEALEVDTRVMDGHALELDDDSFDMAGSQFGVMLFPNMPRGIEEMARVTRPGGRVLMTVYGNPHEIEFLGFFVAAIQAVAPSFEGPPMDPLPLPFQLHDPERLRHELANAGLTNVTVETITEETAFRSGEHMWDWLVHSNPIVGAILSELNLTDEQTAVVREALDTLVRERSGGSGEAVLAAPINIGVGTK